VNGHDANSPRCSLLTIELLQMNFTVGRMLRGSITVAFLTVQYRIYTFINSMASRHLRRPLHALNVEHAGNVADRADDLIEMLYVEHFDRNFDTSVIVRPD